MIWPEWHVLSDIELLDVGNREISGFGKAGNDRTSQNRASH